MREILFRGKSIDNGKWIYGYAAMSGGTFIICDNGLTYGGFIVYEVIPETVGQFTGLTDKNGVRIFEGDILQYEWSGKKNIDYIEYSGNMFTYSECIRFSLSDDEVIGNIHDNPEILNNSSL